MKVKLSIIIINWNTKELLIQCLESIIHNTDPKIQIEVIVVDNRSTDGSVDNLPIVKLSNYELKIMRNKENLGFAKGNNIGIKEAKGEYIMLLNSDTVIKPEAFEKLLAFLDRYDTCQRTAVSPLLLLPDGKFQNDYYMKFPNLWQIFLYHNPILRPIIMRISFLNSLVVQKPSQAPFEVDQLPGTALMASKAVWEKVGLLDEDYHFLFEDVDWCWRAKKLEVKLMVVPEARIIHIGGASWKKKLKENSSKYYYQFFSSMLLFVRKNYSQIKVHIFKWAIILNFLLTLKSFLAWQFIKNGQQRRDFLSQ